MWCNYWELLCFWLGYYVVCDGLLSDLVVPVMFGSLLIQVTDILWHVIDLECQSLKGLQFDFDYSYHYTYMFTIE
jgi:hypothetical protein